jgi:hypothetical protein
MPGIAIHTLLALNVLDGPQHRRDALPFAADDAASRNAFLSGCMGPDMGLLPGADPLISDACHYIQSGELTRNLVRLASSDVERAFAWGWVTHVLADILLHPLINRRVGELRGADSGTEVPYADDAVAHLQVELGLDGVFFYRLERTEQRFYMAPFRSSASNCLAAAYEATYGDVFSAASLITSHRASARYSGLLVSLSRLVGTRMHGRFVPLSLWPMYALGYLPARVVTAVFRPDSLLYGATHSLKPPDWLVEEVDRAIVEFGDRFAELLDDGLQCLPNYNLDLGRVESAEEPYPPTQRTIAALESRRTSTV